MEKRDKLLLTFLGLLVVAAFVGGQIWNSHKNFTKEKWMKYHENSRQFIVQNFLDRTVINGITEEQLLEYLGAADMENEQEMIYYLGKPAGLFADGDGEEELLVVTFEEGKATGVAKVPRSAVK